MSDREGGDDDVGLPKATVFKLIAEILPEDIACGKDAKDLLVECCIEWIKLISTQSNSICEESTKKTISPEHVTEALKHFIKEVEDSNTEFKQSQKERTRTQPNTGGMTQDELMALQEKLFASSKNRFEADHHLGTIYTA